MRRAWRLRDGGRSALETIIAIIVLGVLLSVLMPVLSLAIESAMETQCHQHLGELFRATQIYLHPDRGGNWLPASEDGGPYWFEKIEPLVAEYETGGARERFTCPKAPLAQRGFTRETLSFGWNERECPWGTVFNNVMKPRERVVLGDTLGTAPDGPKADTLVTRSGEFRLDTRHEGRGSLLFLDGHVEGATRGQATKRWPAFTLAPPRPPGQIQNPLMALAWWQWLSIALAIAVPYALALGGVSYWRRLKKAREEKLRRQEEQEEREARQEAEREREQARKEYLRTVPSGPLEEVELPRGTLHLGNRRYQVQPGREMVVGRAERAHVRIRSDTVSREHAKIRPEPRGYVLYDLFSRTGTFVGGKRIQGKVLADGDVIRVGDAELTFELRRD